MAKKNEDGFEPIEEDIEWIDEPKNAPKNMGMFSAAAQGLPTSGNMPLISPPEAKDLLTGAAQGAANVGIGYANFLPGVNIPKRNFAPQNPFAEVGEDAAEFGSYFLPGGLVKILGKGVRSIPFIANAIKSVIPTLEKRSSLNALAKIGKAGAEGGIANAALGEKEEQGINALEGAGIGGTVNALAQAFSGGNPFLSALGRAGIGGTIGASIGAITGSPYQDAVTGAGLGISAPYLAKTMGLTKQKPGLETLEHINQSEVMPRVNAALKLKTSITPGEASGNPYIMALEGEYGRAGAASAEKNKIAMDKIKAEKTAINELLNKIYPTDPQLAKEAKNKIAQLYSEVYKNDLPGKELTKLMANSPLIKTSINEVNRNPAWQEGLKNVSPANYEYLDKVRKALSDEEKTLIRKGADSEARIYTQKRKEFTKLLDENVPQYKIARQEAQRQIIQKNIKKALGSKEITGSNFYAAFLANDNKYNELLNKLKNVPEAQEDLRNMKLAWENLSGKEKAKNAKFQAEKSLSSRRNNLDKLVDYWNNLNGQKTNIEALKFINSGKWQNELDAIQKIKDKKIRNQKLAETFGRIVSGETVQQLSQGSEKDGDKLRTGT